MDTLYAHLRRFAPADWRRAVDALAADIPEIDRNATRIWFEFFPLELHLALERTDDEAAVVRRLGLMGRWRLADQVDASHTFLYAHRFWPQVKSAIAALEQPAPQLPALAGQVADAAARTARVDRERLLGMAAVGLMTLRQAGPEAFAAAPGRVMLSDRVRALSPHQVLRRRAKDDWQGLFGFARGLKKRWTITFDENAPDATFTAIHGQEIASAAQTDKREYRQQEPRCIPGEGPIPVECRSASCGTCWVGVLAGAEKLSPVAEREEGRPMRTFGYGEWVTSSDDEAGAATGGERGNSSGPRLIRLACQAKAFGAVSVVIPPWNGVFGKIMRGKPD
jgi:ferredoxin